MTATITRAERAAARRVAVDQIARMIRGDRGLTGEDVADIGVFVDEDALCEGHESLAGYSTGEPMFCPGHCIPYTGPGPALVTLLISISAEMQESAYDLLQSATEVLGW